jgi:prepilin-type N-terminal cleavage/methylation domain-containing protein
MIRNRSRSGKRSAFTLVELMVVIMIIAILVSLISSAVMKAMQKIPEVTTRTEISQLETALQAFMADYNITEPPPSFLILNEYSPTMTQSGSFLQKLFGKNLGTNVDWNGNGAIDGPAAPGGWYLEGEQCLVFYLGGIPTAPTLLSAFSPQGFSTNNMNPALPVTVSPKRKGPYYTFQVARLKPLTALNPTASPFPVYIDAWQTKTGPFFAALGGTPYAYFSSIGNNNTGYLQNTPPALLPLLDCASIRAYPYYLTGTSPNQFMNPNTYQIISAGKDGIFGIAGSTNTVGTPGWNPAAGAVGVGADDQANFSANLLGSGQS